jgi:hypothetical protein
MTPRYLAQISQKGPVKYGDVPSASGVLEVIDNLMPIGEAQCKTWDERGLAVWTIRIGQAEIPGCWVIFDREFQQAQ